MSIPPACGEDVMACALMPRRQLAHVYPMSFASIVAPLLSGCFAIEREDTYTLALQCLCDTTVVGPRRWWPAP